MAPQTNARKYWPHARCPFVDESRQLHSNASSAPQNQRLWLTTSILITFGWAYRRTRCRRIITVCWGSAGFESNLDVINNAAYARMETVRRFQIGANKHLVAKLLNELATGATLLDSSQKKEAYDESLRNPAGARPATDEVVDATEEVVPLEPAEVFREPTRTSPPPAAGQTWATSDPFSQLSPLDYQPFPLTVVARADCSSAHTRRNDPTRMGQLCRGPQAA